MSAVITTHRWKLRVEKAAQKEFDRLSSKDKRLIFSSLEELLRAENPCAVLGVERLKASECTWKFRQGNYRVFFQIASVSFEIYKGTLVVTNIAIHHTGY